LRPRRFPGVCESSSPAAAPPPDGVADAAEAAAAAAASVDDELVFLPPASSLSADGVRPETSSLLRLLVLFSLEADLVLLPLPPCTFLPSDVSDSLDEDDVDEAEENVDEEEVVDDAEDSSLIFKTYHQRSHAIQYEKQHKLVTSVSHERSLA